MSFHLDGAIRKVPDFPKKGILFYDITSILTEPQAFKYCVDEMERLYSGSSFDAVAGIEARGFVFASAFALRASLPLLLVRKKGKLPGRKLSRTFELEYGSDEIQIHADDVPVGGRILIVDDLIATGGTLRAAAELFREAGAVADDLFCVVGLPFLEYASKLPGYRIRTLIEYHGE